MTLYKSHKTSNDATGRWVGEEMKEESNENWVEKKEL